MKNLSVINPQEVFKDQIEEAKRQTRIWGEVYNTWIVGNIIVVEYQYDTDDGTVLRYKPYILVEHNGMYVNNLCMSFSSLDDAIINTIAVKYNGLNSKAGYYFGKAIGMYDRKE